MEVDTSGPGRGDHEWRVWQQEKLPPGKMVMPGVVSHATNLSNTHSSSPTAFCGTPESSALRTSLSAPIAASAAGSTPTLPGPSCGCLSKAPASRRRSSALIGHARDCYRVLVQVVACHRLCRIQLAVALLDPSSTEMALHCDADMVRTIVGARQVKFLSCLAGSQAQNPLA